MTLVCSQMVLDFTIINIIVLQDWPIYLFVTYGIINDFSVVLIHKMVFDFAIINIMVLQDIIQTGLPSTF